MLRAAATDQKGLVGDTPLLRSLQSTKGRHCNGNGVARLASAPWGVTSALLPPHRLEGTPGCLYTLTMTPANSLGLHHFQLIFLRGISLLGVAERAAVTAPDQGWKQMLARGEPGHPTKKCRSRDSNWIPLGLLSVPSTLSKTVNSSL